MIPWNANETGWWDVDGGPVGDWPPHVEAAETQPVTKKQDAAVLAHFYDWAGMCVYCGKCDDPLCCHSDEDISCNWLGPNQNSPKRAKEIEERATRHAQ